MSRDWAACPRLKRWKSVLSVFRQFYPGLRAPRVSLYCGSPFRDELNCRLRECGCRISSFVWTSERTKWGFIEVPKAGSTSVKRSLEMSVEVPFSMAQAVKKARKQKSANFEFSRPGYGPTASFPALTRELWKMVGASHEIFPSSPKGSFGFRHRFDLGNVEFESYRWFTVGRDPIDRLASALLMFFSNQANSFRKKQREQFSSLVNPNLADFQSVRALCSDVQANANHHFEALTAFVPEPLVATIQVIPAAQLNEFMRTEFGVREVPILNRSVARDDNELSARFKSLLSRAIEGTGIGDDIERDRAFIVNRSGSVF